MIKKRTKFTVMSTRKFTSKFKIKVVLEALKERQRVSELAQKHDLHVQRISKC